MKLAISNLAWDKENNERIYDLMKEKGVRGLEIAPLKVFDSIKPQAKDIDIFLKQVKIKYGLELIAMQSLLFGKPELTLFGNSRDELQDYFYTLILFAKELGIKNLIFGSPKNREYKGISMEKAYDIAEYFFKVVGDLANIHDINLCIEPVSNGYGGNFYVIQKMYMIL